MTNLVEVQYAQTGKSSNTDELGMREMQVMVYAQSHRQHFKWREENPDKTKPEITDGDPLARRIAMASNISDNSNAINSHSSNDQLGKGTRSDI